MDRKQTDQIFNAITSNGCREMDEIRFNQAVNECLEIKQMEKQLQKEAMKQLSLLDQIKELEEEKRELLIEYDQWMSNPEDKIHRSVSEALVDDFLSQNKH